jgi:hypothetical protein
MSGGKAVKRVGNTGNSLMENKDKTFEEDL